MESQGLFPAWDACARGPLSGPPGRWGWGLGRPPRQRSKELLAPSLPVPPLALLGSLHWTARAWGPCFRQTEEAVLSDRQVFLEFSYLLAATVSVHSTRPETVKSRECRGKKTWLSREEGSRGRSVSFLEIANCSQKLTLSFTGMDWIEKLLNWQGLEV